MAVAAVAFWLMVYPLLYVPPRLALAPVVIVMGASPSTIPVAASDVAAATPRVGVTIMQLVTKQKFPLPLVLPVASVGVTGPKVICETLELGAPIWATPAAEGPVGENCNPYAVKEFVFGPKI